MDKVNGLAKWVLEHRPKVAEPPLASGADFAEALSGSGAKVADLGEGLGAILSALETFPNSLAVQIPGLRALQRWASEAAKLAPAKSDASEAAQGVSEQVQSVSETAEGASKPVPSVSETVRTRYGLLESASGTAQRASGNVEGVSKAAQGASGNGQSVSKTAQSVPGTVQGAPDALGVGTFDALALFGGAAQYPGPLSFFDSSTGVRVSTDTPGDHLLLARALAGAAAALDLLVDNDVSCESALLALADLLKVSGTLFDAADFLDKQEKLRRAAAGKEAPPPGAGIPTRVVSKPSQDESDADDLAWDRKGLVLALAPVTQAFSQAATVLRDWFGRPAQGNLFEEALAYDAQSFAALPGAFSGAYENLCRRFWREAWRRETARRASSRSRKEESTAKVPERGEEAWAAEDCLEASSSGNDAGAEGVYVPDEEEEKEYFLDCVRAESGVVGVIEAALKPFGSLLTLADDSATVIEAAAALRQLYELGGLDLFKSGTRVPEGFGGRLTRQPCGADWSASAIRAVFQSLLSHARPCRTVGADEQAKLQRSAEVVNALIICLEAGLSCNGDDSLINRGVAEALCKEPPAMRMLVELLGWELDAQSPLGRGRDLPLSDIVSSLF